MSKVLCESCGQHVGSRLAYSPLEAAELLGVSRVHIYNMHDRGEIKFVKLGRRTLIPATELDRLLDQPEDDGLPDDPAEWLASLGRTF